MYDELVRALRICEDGEHCDLCPKWRDKQNSGMNVCTSALCKEAADAIEELIVEHASLIARATVAEEALRKRRPVARGAWICDQCHAKMLYGPTNFCPKCGADMRPEAPKEDEADV